MKLSRLLILVFITCFSLNGLTQEICDNGIDDDGDGLVDLNDVEDCECVSLIGSSLIPNPSFEVTVCCPEVRGMLTCAETWIQASEPTTDYYHTCGLMEGFLGITMPDLPIPGDGDAFVGFWANSAEWSEYVGACLDAPLIAGTSYVLNLFTAYGSGVSDLNLSIYGATTCVDLPWVGTNCPDGIGSWELLDDVLVAYDLGGSWQEFTLTFTPSVDIYAISIGGPCSMADFRVEDYYFIDELILIDSADFFNLDKVGGWCTDDLILSGITEEEGGTWQWYKDGIALIGEIFIDFEPIPYGEGEFSVVYSNRGYCERYDYFSPGIFDVSFDNEVPPCFPSPISLVNTSDLFYDEPYEWIWNLGDGAELLTEDVTYTYADPGIYLVELIGLSTDPSCNDTSVATLTIYYPPDAVFEIESETIFIVSGNPVSCTNQEIQFNDLSTFDPLAPITSWRWVFGDGTISTEESPIHIYEDWGSYWVKLIVENDFGCKDSMRDLLIIGDLNPDFTYVNNCLYEDLIFENETAALGLVIADEYEWLFGDGGISDLEDPTHAYLDEGIYTVELIAISTSGCRDTIRKEITPYLAPEVSFEFVVTGISSEDGGTGGCHYNPVEFYDHSTIEEPYEIVSWNWNFGDGGTSTDENPIHEYARPGTYSVTLTTESDFGCEATGTMDILMVDGIAIISPDTTICQNGTATIYAQSSDGSPHDYTWSIPGADESRIQTIPAADAPIKIYVYATDPAGCVSPIDSIYVDVLPPITADLTIPIHTCAGDDMNGSV
ncbi:PKD domain-containing protein, partial [Crocinitomix catalasitica]|uniref:PKD domain-containing protein n=1 Tax=Crocinitomix catalasitica TaxID=184607 RepID=UPI00055E2E59